MGRFDAAATALEGALAALDGHHEPDARRLRVRIRITGAWTELELRGLTAALDAIHGARGDAEAFGEPHLLALSHVQEGVIRVRSGDWRAALTALDSVGEDRSTLDPSQRCAMLINRGLAHLALAEIAGSRAALEEARDIAAAHGLAEQEFKARHNLACLAFVDGDLPRALVLMREADAMEASVLRDRARLDHAEVLLEAGLVDGARTVLGDALVAAREEGHRLEEGEISLRLARCDLLTGDLESARVHARAALAAYRTRQARELVREAELVTATIAVAAGTGLGDVVTALARRAEDAGRPGGAPPSPTERAAVRLEAEARLLTGDVAGARARLDSLGTSSRESLAAGLHESLVRARIERATDHTDAAQSWLAEGNRLLAAHQFQSSSLEARAAMALHGRQLAAFDVERALADDDAAGVLATVERWRAVSHRTTPVTTSTDPVLGEMTRELRRLRQVLGESEGPTSEDTLARIAELEPRVAQREWGLAVEGATTTARPPVGADEALAAVEAGGVTVVEFFESAGRLFTIRVDSHGIVVEPGPPVEPVAGLITRLRRDLRARAVAGRTSPMATPLERATAASLRVVDAQLDPRLGDTRRVVVIPSRHLAGLPWGLLPGLAGRIVTVAPSLTRWVRGPARETGVAPSEVMRALSGPGLARAGPEVAAVRAAWGRPSSGAGPARTSGGVDDPGPSPSLDVIDALARARVVHLAAHGTHQAQSPFFSSVRMADGPLFAHEFPRPVAAEHVALSACDVGQFSTRAGDEPLGLATALLSLGATSVLAAVAPVADDLAAEAMVRYHRRLATGEDAATSWAEVAAELPDAGVFCLYGSDWSLGSERVR